MQTKRDITKKVYLSDTKLIWHLRKFYHNTEWTKHVECIHKSNITILVGPQIYSISQSTHVLVLKKQQNIMSRLISKIVYDKLLGENLFSSLKTSSNIAMLSNFWIIEQGQRYQVNLWIFVLSFKFNKGYPITP